MDINNQNEAIDNYLSGRLDPTEVESFESVIASNPELQQEVAFQRNIVEGIKNARKAELKAHLQSIDVAPGVGSVLQSGAAKVTYGIITAGVIGAAAYLGMSDDKQEEVLESAPAVVEETYEAAPDQDDESTVLLASEEAPEPAPKSTNPTPVKTEKKEVVVSEKEEPKTIEESNDHSFTPDIELPDADEFEGASEIETEAIDEADFAAPKKLEDLNVEVEVKQSDSKILRYTYYDEKLSLMGDFSAGPYEVLELNNSDDNKKLFLFYNDRYYALELTSNVKDLSAIKDSKSIQQLDVIRNNK